MSVPSRVDAAAHLLSLDPPPWFVRHGRAVAEIAAWLAGRYRRRMIAVDPLVVEAAALLHDVDKLLRIDDPVRRLPHGEAGAAWARRQGMEELAPAIASHPVTRLTDPDWPSGWLPTASIEERIVAYADKRAGQRLVSMAARFGAWDRRYGPWAGEEPGLVWRNALQLEASVCGGCGIKPEEVRRLAWTGRALRRAMRRRGDAGQSARPDAPGSSPFESPSPRAAEAIE
jgi:putative nucleotidyltransferase with HDIG domain